MQIFYSNNVNLCVFQRTSNKISGVVSYGVKLILNINFSKNLKINNLHNKCLFLIVDAVNCACLLTSYEKK